MHPYNWWHWLADLWTPGTTPEASEREQAQLDQADRNTARRQRKLDEIGRNTEAIRNQLRVEADLMRRQQSQ